MFNGYFHAEPPTTYSTQFFELADAWAENERANAEVSYREDMRRRKPYDIVQYVTSPVQIPWIMPFFASDKGAEQRAAAGAARRVIERHESHSAIFIPYLLRLQQSDHPQARQYALKALGEYTQLPDWVVEELRKVMVKDPKEYVRRAARQIVEK